MAVLFIICKFYCFLKVFVILFFNQYLISRLSSAKKRNIVDEKRAFRKDWTDIRYVYDQERIQGGGTIVPSFPLFDFAF